jgi:hypothetical protein
LGACTWLQSIYLVECPDASEDESAEARALTYQGCASNRLQVTMARSLSTFWLVESGLLLPELRRLSMVRALTRMGVTSRACFLTVDPGHDGLGRLL